MKMLRKITRILGKTLVFLTLFLVILSAVLFVALQTESFQTWAAQRATAYLSSELGARVEIGKLKFSLVKNVTLEDVFVEDQHHDTLVSGKSITVNVKNFSYKHTKLNLDEATLSNVKVKLIKYKGEPDWNFQFLADYFDSGPSGPKDTTKSPWKITYGALSLRNVDFTYRLMRDTDKVVRNMNYNNIHVSNVYGRLSDIDFRGDSIFAQITNLRATEQCGIVLENLTTKAIVAPTLLRCDSIYLKTPNSIVRGKFTFNYTTWDDYNDFINKVYIKGKLIDSTYVSFNDIAYFAEELNDFNEGVYLKGRVRGFVNDLSGSDMDLRYKQNTRFKGDISITGLPDIDKSYIHFDAEKLATSKSDLEKIPLPPFDKPTYLELPDNISRLGVVSYKGKFDGFIHNFATYGTFKTDIGNIRTDLQVNNTVAGKPVKYSGSVSTTNFDFSKIFTKSNIVGPISMNAKITGQGITMSELDTQFDGVVESITYNDYKYDHLKIDGEFQHKIFKGQLVSKDSSANFDFNGTIDFNNKLPRFDFISTINNFDLAKTNFATKQLNGRVSSQIYINLNGDDLDNLSGQVNLDNTVYDSGKKKYTLPTFNLELNQEEEIKTIALHSSIANATLKGKYKLSTLPDAFTQYLNSYFPTFVKTHTRFIFNDEADIDIRIKNFTPIQELFIKDLSLSPNTTVKGSFDAAISYLYLKTNSELIDYSGIKFRNNTIDVNSLINGVSIKYDASSINLSDSFAFRNPTLKVVANDKVSSFNMGWNNFSMPDNEGDITGNIIFGSSQAQIDFNRVKFVINDSTWQIVKLNPVYIDSSFYITVKPITFYNQNQLITFDGRMSADSSEKMDIFVQNFKLSQFNGLLADAQITLDGMLTGNTSVYGMFGKRIIDSDFSFNGLMLNNKLIGNAEVKSTYDRAKQVVKVDGFSAFAKDFDGNLLKNIEFKGYYFPEKDTNNVDITFKAEPFDISLLQPYLKDILTIKVGYLNGTGRVTGTPAEPKINAKLKFYKCVMLVDYLNVQYNVSGNVDIYPTQINFENIEIRDKYGNVGSVYGNIFHSNFKNMRIDFDINTNKLMLLNTNSGNNPDYYGTAYASGNAGIYGFVDDIKMEMTMKTAAGTRFYIPLDGPSEIGNNEFIRFVTKDTVKVLKAPSASGFSLDFNLEATPDAEVQLIFDEKSGDIIKARGEGNLNMKINSKGKFDMYGDYVLTTGDYLFTLENFITKKFEIQKGSSIKWNGSVYKANIDIAAIYRQRASVRPIYPADSSGKRYTVDCKLYMKNKLMAPDITFGIELPTIDENSRSAIASVLMDENELNRQVFALLLLRSFITPLSGATGGSGITAGGAAANTSTEMLSNKLSTWLNGVTKDVDVGVNYRPGTGLSNEELDLTLNKQLFNNRLVIDGNFGVSNNSNSSRSSSNANGNNLIGDVTLEYKLSSSGKYRVKGFNRSNDNTQVINNGGPFTQGVGIFYREEFESLNELYRRYISKVKKSKPVTSAGNP
jgi:hypothetical protein